MDLQVIPQYVKVALDLLKVVGIPAENIQQVTNDLVRRGHGQAATWINKNPDKYLKALHGGYVTDAINLQKIEEDLTKLRGIEAELKEIVAKEETETGETLSDVITEVPEVKTIHEIVEEIVPEIHAPVDVAEPGPSAQDEPETLESIRQKSQ